MSHYEIVDNFLHEDYFKHLDKQILHMGQFKWSFQECAVAQEDESDIRDNEFYFISSFYNNLQVEDNFYYQLKPLFDALQVKSIIRCRAIMYMNQGEIVKHSPHIDMDYSNKAALLYMNTCNGYTGMINDDWKIGDKPNFDQDNRVESIENRLCLHDGSVPHYSTTCTDDRKRLLIAINYF